MPNGFPASFFAVFRVLSLSQSGKMGHCCSMFILSHHGKDLACVLLVQGCQLFLSLSQERFPVLLQCPHFAHRLAPHRPRGWISWPCATGRLFYCVPCHTPCVCHSNSWRDSVCLCVQYSRVFLDILYCFHEVVNFRIHVIVGVNYKLAAVFYFWYGAMGHRIDHSWCTHWAISRSSQCSTTGVTKAVVCVNNVCMMYKLTLAANRKE